MYWRARVSTTSDLVKTSAIDLTAELERVTDDFHCPAGQTFCVFDVPLVDDSVITSLQYYHKLLYQNCFTG